MCDIVQDTTHPFSYTLPCLFIFKKRTTHIVFVENQLLPGSIGISPLFTTHPKLLQQLQVRSSIGQLTQLQTGHK